MKVYRIIPNSNRYSCLEARSRDRLILNQFRGTSLAKSWKTIKLKWDDTVGKRGDFPSLMSPLVFSQRAWDALSELIGDSVEALPVDCEGEIYYAINVLDVRDCLDQSKSQFVRFDSGRVMYVKVYHFIKACLKDAIIWKIPETVGREVLVSEVFKKEVEKHNLKGLLFEKPCGP